MAANFQEALAASFERVDGRHVFRFGPESRFTLELEPRVLGGYSVALYEQAPGRPYPELLLKEKLPMMSMPWDES